MTPIVYKSSRVEKLLIDEPAPTYIAVGSILWGPGGGKIFRGGGVIQGISSKSMGHVRASGGPWRGVAWVGINQIFKGGPPPTGPNPYGIIWV